MRYAIVSRENSDSLVKGIGLLDKGGGKRGGGNKVFDEMVLPSVCCPLVFCVCWAKKKSKNWREVHPLDPLVRESQERGIIHTPLLPFPGLFLHM